MKKMLLHPMFWIFAALLGFSWCYSHRKSDVAAPSEVIPVCQPFEVIQPSKWLCGLPKDDGSKKCVRAIQTRDANGSFRMELMVQLVEVKDKKAVMFFPLAVDTMETLDDVDFGDGVTVIIE